MFYIYAISSAHRNYIYVGMTESLEERFERHQSGRERTTKAYRPFKLIFSEALDVERKVAKKREKYWKSGIGKEKLRQLRDQKYITFTK
ncbi:GIY-YIG nuclease family protein [Subsaximicrobium wynnwilliamsii]|uniref:GIY-YIG nuclease family protein n=3 Tax=Subsaximicrobium wynnwilliamsii TaxID=291179 RepID=A0A5C6ZCN3_9FLAO|nr:GIY-YIG nuclease family protein [Subsaximicrobium wynnwilliamsii]TXD86807.1 GIY-YIG nuclease family protein [Subsaximicrobium wynnwilliamsii]